MNDSTTQTAITITMAQATVDAVIGLLIVPPYEDHAVSTVSSASWTLHAS
jgi:hypothetical protein